MIDYCYMVMRWTIHKKLCRGRDSVRSSNLTYFCQNSLSTCQRARTIYRWRTCRCKIKFSPCKCKYFKTRCIRSRSSSEQEVKQAPTRLLTNNLRCLNITIDLFIVPRHRSTFLSMVINWILTQIKAKIKAKRAFWWAGVAKVIKSSSRNL